MIAELPGAAAGRGVVRGDRGLVRADAAGEPGVMGAAGEPGMAGAAGV